MFGVALKSNFLQFIAGIGSTVRRVIECPAKSISSSTLRALLEKLFRGVLEAKPFFENRTYPLLERFSFTSSAAKCVLHERFG